MGANSPHFESRNLPDLPLDLDSIDIYPRRRRPARPVSGRTAPPPRARQQPTTRPPRVVTRREDEIVSVRTVESPSERPPRAPREPLVLPPMRALLSEAAPSLVMAVTAFAAAIVGARELLNVPLWALAMAVPPLLVFALADDVTQPQWKRASVVDLSVLLAIFPILVVRQSVSRIPFMDTSNGTMMAPMLMTLLLLAGLTAVGVASSVLTRDDPEYSGVVFLPAAMFVPLFAGATSITSLRTAMLMSIVVYVTTAILTVVASVAPRQYVMGIAPATIALEFVILTAVRGSDIFPIGAGFVSKLIFFFVVAYTVALTIAVPMLSYWVRHVALIFRQELTAQQLAQPPRRAEPVSIWD